MNAPLSEAKRLLLQKLQRGEAKGGLSVKDFVINENDVKRLGLTIEQVEAIRAELVADGLVRLEPARSKRSQPKHRITSAGAEALRQPPPPPEGYNEHLAPYCKFSMLCAVLRCADQRATPGQVVQRLSTREKPALGLVEPTPEGKLAINQPLVRWLLDQLADANDLIRTVDRNSVSYRLTEAGRERLGVLAPYPRLEFRLSSEHLATLMEMARIAGKSISEPKTVPVPPPIAAATVTAADVLAVLELLLRDRHATHGMVPIHEMRHIIAERHGAAAADHATFDKLLHDLRKQGHVRLIALGNPAGTTEQQRADSIPGEGELYFSVEAAHEPAAIG